MTLVHVHLSETKKEHEDCLTKYGLTPAQLLDCHGLWKNGGTAAHCVWLTQEDASLLARRGCERRTQPREQSEAGHGTADVAMMRRLGVNAAWARTASPPTTISTCLRR